MTKAGKCSSAFAYADSGTKKEIIVGVSFEDGTNSLTENGANQNIGFQYQGSTFQAGYFAFRFFSRLAWRISLYSSISSSSDAPQVAIIASRSFSAARMASISALRLRFCSVR